MLASTHVKSGNNTEPRPRLHVHVAAGVGIAGLCGLAALLLLMYFYPCERNTREVERPAFRAIVS